jgi:glutathione S-transferase
MITIYGRRTSSNVQPVIWALTELGVPHERLDYGHRFGGLDTPEYGAMNPNRRVPTLKEGDFVLWESAAILRYLANRFGGAPFWPDDPAARAHVDMWAEWGKATWTAAFIEPIFWARVRTAAADRDEAALARAVKRFTWLVRILEAQLAGRDYVTGDDFTLADIAIGTHLYRYFDIDIAREDSPAVSAYYARLCERPAYRDHVMVPYDDLKVPGA